MAYKMGYGAETMSESIHQGYNTVERAYGSNLQHHSYAQNALNTMSGYDMRSRPITIEVQPPKVIQKGVPMWPPLVVSILAEPEETITFQVLVQDASGSIKNPWDDTYYSSQGCLVMNGQYLDGENKLYAIFPDIVFNSPARKYRFHITTTKNYGAETVDICDNTVQSNPEFKVTVHSTSTERGSKEERELLRRMRASRVFDVPKAPK
ncbi:hypothetical protein TruAng_005334 [Truncatella angustata]|nr:hypothetical protein TruAng_005334 [Truncatella angustata]